MFISYLSNRVTLKSHPFCVTKSTLMSIIGMEQNKPFKTNMLIHDTKESALKFIMEMDPTLDQDKVKEELDKNWSYKVGRHYVLVDELGILND